MVSQRFNWKKTKHDRQEQLDNEPTDFCSTLNPRRDEPIPDRINQLVQIQPDCLGVLQKIWVSVDHEEDGLVFRSVVPQTLVRTT